MDLYTELKWIQAQALIGRGIHSREHLACIAIETRLRTLEAEVAALRLALAAAVNEAVDVAADSLYDHPNLLRHKLACPRCAGKANS